ncbi:hypothetical protein CEXT_721191 [Caerostris extrusa]|uniref:Uncharacterized protein n=1 Tax=Caerostris extrusa TaxID=172846 RepID=A0AAV4V8K2_CAEEX|nr:hypothetical protein CEXT_721191 [Caerostris extrusa]
MGSWLTQLCRRRISISSHAALVREGKRREVHALAPRFTIRQKEFIPRHLLCDTRLFQGHVNVKESKSIRSAISNARAELCVKRTSGKRDQEINNKNDLSTIRWPITTIE